MNAEQRKAVSYLKRLVELGDDGDEIIITLSYESGKLSPNIERSLSTIAENFL